MTKVKKSAIFVSLMSLIAACDSVGNKSLAEIEQDASASSQPDKIQGTLADIQTMGAGPSAPITQDCTKLPFGPAAEAEKIIFTVNGKLLKSIGGMGQTMPRNIKRKIGSGTPVEDDKNPEIDLTYWPTNVDFAVDQPKSNTFWKEVKIKIAGNLANDVKFLTPRDNTGAPNEANSSYAITAEPAKTKYFCRFKDFERDNTDRVVRFGILMPPDTTMSFNIGLVAKDLQGSTDANERWIPIYIDPNIKNVG